MRSNRNPVELLGTAAAIVTFIVLYATTQDIGVTWDEPIYNEAAERAAHWFALLLRGEVAQAFDPHTFGISWGLLNEHPPLFRSINALGWSLTHGWMAAPLSHRIGSIAFAAAGVGVLVGLVARWRSPRTALFAAAALVAMPRLFFHMHLSTLDFPLALVWMLGTLFFYQQMRSPSLARVSLRRIFVVGAWIGLGLLTKINAVLLLPFWGLWLLLYRRTRRHWITFALSLPVGLLVLVAGWPWIWKDPIGGLWNWVHFFRVHFEIRQWFAGQLYVDTPWYLPFAMVLITTPVALLVLAIIGAANAKPSATIAPRRPLASTFRVPRSAFRIPHLWIGLHLLGIAVVLGYYALPMTPIHDQERLLLPAILHLALLSGEGFDRLWSWIAPRLSSAWRVAPVQVGLATLLLLPGIVLTARLHPHQLAYYNELVGGVSGARRLDLETIYFASTYGSFLPVLNQLPPGAVIWVMPNSWDVLYYYQQNDLLRDDLVVLRPPGWGSFYDDQGVHYRVGTLADADYALIERRQTTFNDVIPEYAIQLDWAAERPVLAQVTHGGVVLATLHSRQ